MSHPEGEPAPYERTAVIVLTIVFCLAIFFVALVI